MYKKIKKKRIWPCRQLYPYLLRMKLILLFLFLFIMPALSSVKAQKITISKKNIRLKEAFREIKRQTGFNYLWAATSIDGKKLVNVSIVEQPLEIAIQTLLADLPLTYIISKNTILVQEKKTIPSQNLIKPRGTQDLLIESSISNENHQQKGKFLCMVIDSAARPIEGVTVQLKGQKFVMVSNSLGKIQLPFLNPTDILVFSSIGYISQEIPFGKLRNIVVLKTSTSTLDEMQIIGYGKKSRRLSTGNVVSISGEEIQRSPVMNPMSALIGKVPGMIISENKGIMPGAGVNIQIRGATRVDKKYGAGETPLIIVDGIPLSGGNIGIGALTSGFGAEQLGISPFSTINSADIQSIEVLKDADATAIYGSRGASGVILITTKRGTQDGRQDIQFRTNMGLTKGRKPNYLSTSEYVMLRKEAFNNDGVVMNNTNGYDLLLWDTTRTGLMDALIGGTATLNTYDGNFSGGNQYMNYRIGGSYNRQTTVFPMTKPNTNANGNMSLGFTSANRKFNAVVNGSYTSSKRRAPLSDLSQYLDLPPNYQLYNDDGSLAWNEGGIYSINPLSALYAPYNSDIATLRSDLNMSYSLFDGFYIRLTAGYNQVNADDVINYSSKYYNPLDNLLPMSKFGKRKTNGFNVEPQITFKKYTNFGNFNFLFGATKNIESLTQSSFGIKDYKSDDFLGTLLGVTSANFQSGSSNATEYKYAALFSRVEYNLKNTYLINFSGRRDGSSRFGPNYRLSNFGAIGAGWIFSNEQFAKSKLAFLSYGKIRGSYGITGNDKIGDYLYRDVYSVNLFNSSYGGNVGIIPQTLFKPDLHWEMNRKLEFGIELGFLKDRAYLSGAWYRNITQDPLVLYNLPYSTGFKNISANLKDVKVQNKGVELMLSTKNIVHKNFQWNSSFNISLPNNKLLSFPGLSQSTYADQYEIGKSINLIFLNKYLGVNPATGLDKIADLNGNGIRDFSTLDGDLKIAYNMEPSFYGGFGNDFSYKGMKLNIFIDFNKQYQGNWKSSLITKQLGGKFNLDRIVLDRWQNEGDITTVPKATQNIYNLFALEGPNVASMSEQAYQKVFYARLQNVQLGYNIPKNLLEKLKLKNLMIFIQGQNIALLVTKGMANSSVIRYQVLGPIKTYAFGLQVNL